MPDFIIKVALKLFWGTIKFVFYVKESPVHAEQKMDLEVSFLVRNGPHYNR